ncbi:hypothetical protein [Kutzneria buriramensis]|uniref:Secreted protein n=1 Tax=Kutzneria buriramensis TaxID=1045776 RepID=A0A3E0H1J1_9PSEU|nr:hypothetical protein [Kutzneria buriramensis]REH36134.1 hypothetical protein BCF44_1163 [Kutzneria buriramensis]
MNTASIRRVAATVLTAGVLVGAAGAAQASTGQPAQHHPTTSAATAQHAPTFANLPHFLSSANMPTWVWGPTQLCFYGSGEVEVQWQLAGWPQFFPVNGSCVSGWGFGIPVHVTNFGFSPVTVVSI